jgi:6-phosphofructokinase 2
MIATLTMNPALDVTSSVAKVEPTHKLRCTDPRFDPGGGGINVARVVHALGGEVTALFPSGGPVGQALEGLLGEAGVPIAAVPIAGATRESFTVDEEESGKQFRFVLPGPELREDEQEKLLEALEAVPGPPAYVVASGSLPPGCGKDFYARLAHRLKGGPRLIVDTSGEPLAALEGARVFLIKPSYSELGALVGRDVSDEDAQVSAARELIERGFAETVLVSLAERGALVVSGEVEQRFEAIPVEARSGVGAGDSMIAALTLALARGEPLVEAVRWGIAAGAAALNARGTQLASREDVERLHAGMQAA